MGKVVVANDHGAVELTKQIVRHLQQRGFEVNHLGVLSTDSVDYPDMAAQACGEFLAGGYEFGVLCCGTGIGISISANKIDGSVALWPQNTSHTDGERHNNVNFIPLADASHTPNRYLRCSTPILTVPSRKAAMQSACRRSWRWRAAPADQDRRLSRSEGKMKG